jgi:integrase
MVTVARRPKGEVRTHTRTDGLTTFSLRFTADGRRQHVTLGQDVDGWTLARAQRELEKTLALVAAGIWRPEESESQPPREESTFEVYATAWLDEKSIDLAENTRKDYEWRLSCHLLPFFEAYKPSEIDEVLVDRYRKAKVDERREAEELRRQGVVIRDERGMPLRGLANVSINRTLELLAAILDDAIDLEANRERTSPRPNPARGKKRRLKVKKRQAERPGLEADELLSLIEAAEALDRHGGQPEVEANTDAIRRMRDQERLKWSEIAARVGLSPTTCIYHYQRPRPMGHVRRPRARRAIISTLGFSGLRVTELCDLNWRHVDLAHGKLRVLDSKTDRGIRDVDIGSRLLEELRTYRADLGGEVELDAPVFATSTGGRRNKDNVNKRILKPAIKLANALRGTRGLPPLPEGVTPHSLRVTYITMLLAAGNDLAYVMDQVGHEDAQTTTRIYMRLLKRRRRHDVDQAFEELLEQGQPKPVSRPRKNPAAESPDHGRDPSKSTS